MNLDDFNHLCPSGAVEWKEALIVAMAEGKITGALREAAFIANVIHETQSLTRFTENLNYSAQRLMLVWPSRFKDMAMAREYAQYPEALANKVYANRMGNGDEASGDGYRYRGRGPAMLTGKDLYAAFGHNYKLQTNENPDLLLEPRYGSLSAVWFWNWKGLGALADRQDFEAIVRRWNGGLIGYTDREAIYETALGILA